MQLLCFLQFLLFLWGGGVAQSFTNKPHCAVILGSSGYDFISPDRIPENAESPVLAYDCFETVAEAVNFSTGGNLNITRNVSIEQIEQAVNQHNAQLTTRQSQSDTLSYSASFSRGVYYDAQNYAGPSITVGTNTACDAAYVPDLRNSPWFFNDRIESSYLFGNCSGTFFYVDKNYSGSWSYCGTACFTLGSLNNRVTSLIVTK